MAHYEIGMFPQTEVIAMIFATDMERNHGFWRSGEFEAYPTPASVYTSTIEFGSMGDWRNRAGPTERFTFTSGEVALYPNMGRYR